MKKSSKKTQKTKPRGAGYDLKKKTMLALVIDRPLRERIRKAVDRRNKGRKPSEGLMTMRDYVLEAILAGLKCDEVRSAQDVCLSLPQVSADVPQSCG